MRQTLKWDGQPVRYSMYQHILLPTDGSDVAERAGDLAVSVAERFDATLHVLSVVKPGKEDQGEDRVTRVVEVANDRGVDTETEIIASIENVSTEILGHAHTVDAQAIVMGTTGRTRISRFILGSTAMQTVQNATIPVMTVHEDTDPSFLGEDILVPTDGSSGADAAAETAIGIARETGATLHTMFISDEPAAKQGESPAHEVAERAKQAGVRDVEVIVRAGSPDAEIASYISEANCDLVVMGAHGRTGLRRYVLGSTTERMLRFSTVPVVTVRSSEDTSTVEYLNYEVISEQGWSLDDGDLFEKAEKSDLDAEDFGSLQVDKHEYLLDAAEAAGYEWPFHCRAGGCIDCAAVLIEGEVEMERCRSLSDEEIEEERLRLTCTARPTSEEIRLVYNAKLMDLLKERAF